MKERWKRRKRWFLYSGFWRHLNCDFQAQRMRTTEHAGFNVLWSQLSLTIYVHHQLLLSFLIPWSTSHDSAGLDWSLPSKVHRKDELAPPGEQSIFSLPTWKKTRQQGNDRYKSRGNSQMAWSAILGIFGPLGTAVKVASGLWWREFQMETPESWLHPPQPLNWTHFL